MNNSPRPITTAEYHAMMAADMREDVLQERVRQLCLLHGWRYYHTHRAQHSPAGFPDVCAIRRDRLLFAELKREAPRYKPTAEQQAWLSDLRAYAQTLAQSGPIWDPPTLEVYLWRPSDLIAGNIAEILK